MALASRWKNIINLFPPEEVTEADLENYRNREIMRDTSHIF
jgi:hypothetical protein